MVFKFVLLLKITFKKKYLMNLDRAVVIFIARIIIIQSFGADLEGLNLRCVLAVELSEALAFIILHNLLL